MGQTIEQRKADLARMRPGALQMHLEALQRQLEQIDKRLEGLTGRSLSQEQKLRAGVEAEIELVEAALAAE